MLMLRNSIRLIIVFWLITFGIIHADEKQVLERLLVEFLAGQTEAHHERFWADELVYTSSSGTRFGKDHIMSGFRQADDSETTKSDDTVAKTVYSASDIDIRVHDGYAIVAFKLIATEEGKVVQTYWNTGTFAPRESGWQAIAWQATMIPNQAN